jgi:hypothetical protein
MSFNELNIVEYFIIQKLSGVILSAEKTKSVVIKEEAVDGSFPRK